MNEELLQQAIDQLKMFKDAKAETVSVENTEYGDGTMRFSVEVTYEDELCLEDERSHTATITYTDEDFFKSVAIDTLDANNITVGDHSVALEYDSEGHKQFIKDNLNKFVKFK